MDFRTFLKTKRIDPDSLKKADPSMFHSWEILYGYVHPNSFVRQKLFVINKIRRAHPYEGEIPKPEVKARPAVKPAKVAKVVGKKAVIKPKVKSPDDPVEEKEVKSVKPKPVRPKPVMKPKSTDDKGNSSEVKTSRKPRPVIKPKMVKKTGESSEDKTESASKSAKPKMARPVMKKKPENKEANELKSDSTGKKKMPRPVMKKPKINRPNKDENDV